MKTFLKKHYTKVKKTGFFISRYFVILVFGLVFFSFASANLTSTSFQIENPSTAVVSGGQSTSSSFQYLSSLSQILQGQSSSTSFTQNAGFLYFPSATSPVVSATPGDTSVALTWTAAVGTLANITSYEVGVSTSSGGIYTFTDVGAVLSSTSTGLSNGVTYYFKIRSYAAGVLLSESAIVSSTPVGGSGGGGGGSGGGGGGGGGGGEGSSPTTSNTNIIFFGKAYPNSSVTLLKDSQVVASTFSGSDANFSIRITGVNPGNYIFSVYSTDKDGVRSPLQAFPITITDGVTINVGGIFIAPTISGDKSQVKQGDNITFFGQAVPESEVTIAVHSDQEIFTKVNTDKNGIYLRAIDTSVLDIGDHSAKSKVAFEGQISNYGNAYNFKVGLSNVDTPLDQTCPAKGDLNNDCRVNLVDFSIAAFWYKKTLSGQAIVFEQTKLNNDKQINLVDFSIMAYYWTG